MIHHRPPCPLCGEWKNSDGSCDCQRPSDPTPEEMDRLLGSQKRRAEAISAALASEDDEVRRRFAAPEGHEHVERPLVVGTERKAAESQTCEVCGVKLDGTCFLAPLCNHSPTSAYHGSEKNESRRVQERRVSVQRRGRGRKDAE